MTSEEIMEFSQNINLKELRNYRIAVGRKTREIILKLDSVDLKRKIEPQRLQRVLDEGAVQDVESATYFAIFSLLYRSKRSSLSPLLIFRIKFLSDILIGN